MLFAFFEEKGNRLLSLIRIFDIVYFRVNYGMN